MRWHRNATQVTPPALSWLEMRTAAAQLLAWGRFWAAAQPRVCPTTKHSSNAAGQELALGRRLQTVPLLSSAPPQASGRFLRTETEKGGSSTDCTPYFFPIKCSAIKKQGAYPCQGAMTLTKMQQLHLLTPKPIQLPHADCIQTPYCNLILHFHQNWAGHI